MPTPTVSGTWRVKRLDDLLPTIRLGKVRLFTNVITPSPTDQWWQYLEPTGSWYNPRGLSALSDAVWNAAAGAQSQGGPYMWMIPPSGSEVTIQGAWVSDEIGRFLSAVVADTPIPLTPGGPALAVSVVFTL